MTEVIGKIKRTRSKSAPSPLDGISYEIFKRCPALWPALLDLYNCCWRSCSVPECWKQAIIKLIPKQPVYADPSVLSNFRPIALTPAIGKLYTNIIKDRWTSFMVKNHYWTLDTQKAFIDGVPGCLEHQFDLFGALKDARQHQRSICCCWLDFKNAFGSVPHKLTQFAIRHYDGPARVGAIVDDLYSGLESSVFFKGSITKPFPYRVGVFQGDPLSVSIFNTVTCLLNSALSSEQHLSRGYKLTINGDKVNQLWFADDGTLVSNSEKNCQLQCDVVERFLNWSGIEAKVVKCRSLAFRSRPKSEFYGPMLHICGQQIPFVGEAGAIFLGLPLDLSLSTDKIQDMITTKVDEVSLPATLKLKLYRLGICPRLNWLISLADLPLTWIERQAESITTKFLKRWCHLARRANVAVYTFHWFHSAFSYHL